MEVDRIYALKKQLKKWEAAFFETHERKPSKTDIEAGPQRIQGKMSIHTPPVEDFGKVDHRGECEFSNASTLCVIFRLGLSQRE